MDDSPRLQIENEESKQRAKEEICHLQEVTRPDVFGMIPQECGPGLSCLSRCARMFHVLLNGAFADANAQLQQLTSNTFGSQDADFVPPFP